ncbi:hypothetical protein OHB26_07560 [Nocardia sp. NBC_01503]|uniref:hypothetical protein n=1 Tax=Nocardia sp. NBC_01503 TaxID=2975997 RepID=UPI002E7BC6E4|nr:hypothetical protein [Nocardia sp. NBC_01503]WTL34062.1 hypothetical protein OHB26_07560 [Nocardia sp. NBC_01503]
MEFGEFGGDVFGGADHQVLVGAHTVFELLAADREAACPGVFGAQEVCGSGVGGGGHGGCAEVVQCDTEPEFAGCRADLAVDIGQQAQPVGVPPI